MSAGTTVSIESAVLAKQVQKLAEITTPATVLKVIGLRLMAWVDESFKTRGRGLWAPLAWSTLALRQRGGDQPLQDTGRYRQSFVSETDQSTYVEVGSSLKTPSGLVLAAIHENGTRPFTIRVRTAKVLAARYGSGAGGAAQSSPLGLINSRRTSGWAIFGKEVQHPGIPARPVLPNQPQAEQLVKTTVEDMIVGASLR